MSSLFLYLDLLTYRPIDIWTYSCYTYLVRLTKGIRDMEHQDQIRFYSIQLLAWMIWDGVECKLEERHEVDWLTAEKVVDSKKLVDYLLTQTSKGISQEAFNRRFISFIQQAYATMINERDQHLSSTIYGNAKPIVSVAHEATC